MSRRNVGGLDRAARLALGLVLFPLGLFLLVNGYGYGLAFAILGRIGLFSGTTGFCVLYVPFRFSTKRSKPAWGCIFCAPDLVLGA